MEVTLRVLEGKNAGQEITITGHKFFIGRADDCHLRPRSEMVSRHHCVILVEEDFAAVRDFGSKNGTFVNDQQVKGERDLNSGDRLRVGTLQFEVRLAGGAAAEQNPKVEPLKEAALSTVSAASDESIDDDNLDVWLGIGEPAEASTRTVTIDDLLGASESDAEPRDGRKPTAPEGQANGPNQPVKVVGVSEKRAKAITAPSSRGAAEEALKKMLRGGR